MHKKALLKQSETSGIEIIKEDITNTIFGTTDGVFSKLEFFEKADFLNPKLTKVTSVLQVKKVAKPATAKGLTSALNLKSTMNQGKNQILGLLNKKGGKGDAARQCEKFIFKIHVYKNLYKNIFATFYY